MPKRKFAENKHNDDRTFSPRCDKKQSLPFGAYTPSQTQMTAYPPHYPVAMPGYHPFLSYEASAPSLAQAQMTAYPPYPTPVAVSSDQITAKSIFLNFKEKYGTKDAVYHAYYYTGKKRNLLLDYLRKTAKTVDESSLDSFDGWKAIGWNNSYNFRIFYYLAKMPATILEVTNLLSALAKKMEASKAKFNAQDISNILYGLQGMSSDSAEVCAVLSALASKITESSAKLDAQAIGNALYGLQGMSSDSAEVCAVLSALASKITESSEKLSPQAIGNALYGLQGMSSDSAEVRAVLSALASKITKSSAKLDAQEIGNALYGLQGMSSDSAEVYAVLSALASKITESSEELRAQHVGNALYGLQGMSSDSAEVRAVLSALASKITESSAKLDAQAIGNALYGLQGMSSDSAEVCAVLSALAIKITESSAKLDAQEIGNALYGLQGMSSDSAEVRAVLRVLTDKLDTCTDLSAETFFRMSYVLKERLRELPEVEIIFQKLNTKRALLVGDTSDSLSEKENEVSSYLQTSYQEILLPIWQKAWIPFLLPLVYSYCCQLIGEGRLVIDQERKFMALASVYCPINLLSYVRVLTPVQMETFVNVVRPIFPPSEQQDISQYNASPSRIMGTMFCPMSNNASHGEERPMAGNVETSPAPK